MEMVRSKTGAGAARDFDSPLGTPVVVDVSTGICYVVKSDGTIVEIGQLISTLNVTGTLGVGITASGGSVLRVGTSAGAEPTANENTSAASLISTATAGVNVGPSLRFIGESGNGVTPYSFAMIQGYKASAVAADYSGALRFSIISAAGGVVAPVLITTAGLSSTAISASGIISADGGQIKFPATAVPSSDVNTLDDYEEGTWTPNDSSGASLTFTAASGSYTKVGRLVYVNAVVVYPVTVSGANALIGGLPFTLGALNAVGSCYTTGGTVLASLGVATTTFVVPVDAATGVARTNAQMSGSTLAFTMSYEV